MGIRSVGESAVYPRPGAEDIRDIREFGKKYGGNSRMGLEKNLRMGIAIFKKVLYHNEAVPSKGI